MCSVIAGCTAAQPENDEIVSAYEIPLQSEQERAEFMSILSRLTEAEGLHAVSATEEETAQINDALPTAELTLRATFWRGDAQEITVFDQHDPSDQVWVMFSRGDDFLADRLREQTTREILVRWPDTQSLPIMPNGNIPWPSELIRTPDGYIVTPSAARKYYGDVDS